MEDISRMTNEELSQALSEYGITPGPVVQTTRLVYERKLSRLRKGWSDSKRKQFWPRTRSSQRNRNLTRSIYSPCHQHLEGGSFNSDLDRRNLFKILICVILVLTAGCWLLMKFQGRRFFKKEVNPSRQTNFQNVPTYTTETWDKIEFCIQGMNPMFPDLSYR